MIEYAVIGAGITGSATAYFLSQASKKVILFDAQGVAGGGSGAAGAFIAPKIAKGGTLLPIVNDAYLFSLDFYSQFAPEILIQNGLIQIPQSESDKELFSQFYRDTSLHCESTHQGLFFPQAAVIDPMALCSKLTTEVEVKNEQVHTITYEGDYWHINDEIKAKHIILAQGAAPGLLEDVYLHVRPIWGERITIKTATKIEHNLHQSISISASNAQEEVVLGATHHQHLYESDLHPEDAEYLLETAKQMIDIHACELLDHRGGARAGSVDYLPIVGPIVNTQASLEKEPNIINGKKVAHSDLVYYPNISIINGVGGRGFVLGPFLAQQLVTSLTEKKELPLDILPQRLFFRWAKRQTK